MPKINNSKVGIKLLYVNVSKNQPNLHLHFIKLIAHENFLESHRKLKFTYQVML